MKRILIFELNWLGDILFSFPFLRALRNAYPEAYIACAVVSRYSDLLKNVPWINKIHCLSDDNSGLMLLEKIKFVNNIRKEGYDTCFFLKPSKTKALMAFFAGISERIGFAGKSAPLTKSVALPSSGLHRASQILHLLDALGIQETDASYEYFVTDEDETRRDALLRSIGKGANRTIAINPGANWDTKRWPPENFINLAKRIVTRFSDVDVMVTGSQKDIKLSERIVREVNNFKCYTTAGKTTLNELAALFKRCELVISADSGPLHLASSVGAKTISLFGPTSPSITGPCGRGENIVISKCTTCGIPCYVDRCEKGYECMGLITVDDVFETVQKIVEL